MPAAIHSISRPQLRSLLAKLLTADSSLDAFVIDYFPSVSRRLTQTMDRVAKVNVLMEQAEPDEILFQLRRHVGDAEVSAALELELDFAVSYGESAPTDVEPRIDVARVFVAYATADREAYALLRKHLAPLDRAGAIVVRSAEDVPLGEEVLPAIERMLVESDIFIILMSPDLFGSDGMSRDVNRMLARARAGEAALFPVLLRPVDLESSAFSGMVILPRDGRPIAARRDQDEAWVEVTRELRSAVQYRARPQRQGSLTTESMAVAAAAPAPQPRQVFQIGDIFRTTSQPNLTFVEPQQLTELTVYLDIMGQGLVVEGPSGVGKTTAVRRALKDTAANTLPQHWVRSKEASQIQALDRALEEGFTGHLIVDDFHYLDSARQGRLADQIKSLADQGRSDAKITLIGINPVGISLTQGFPDLVGRFKRVTMKRQPTEKVAELVRKGELAANVIFLRRDEFVREARGSFYTAQLLCFTACVREGVTKTVVAGTEKVIQGGPADLRESVIDDLRNKYHEALTTFASYDEATPPRGACLILLWLLSQERFDFVTLFDASNEFPELAPAFAWLKSGRLAEHFLKRPELAKLLHYDDRSGVLSAEDPQLDFYLRNLAWPWFAQMTGHRNLRFDADGRPSLRHDVVGAVTATGAGSAAISGFVAAGSGATGTLTTTPATVAAPPSEGIAPVPTALREALAAGRVIPFVGAGVSMAVIDTNAPGNRLFPSWAGLLEKAALRLETDGAAGDAMAVRGALLKKIPNYLDAARDARDGLGAIWFTILRKALDPPRQRAVDSSLALSRAIWQLGSKLLVTTNYDRVLHWTCPDRDDLRYWDIQAPAELVQLLQDGLDYPTIWHLHGYIGNAVDLILTPDGYSRLYPNATTDEDYYRAALTSLRILLASRTFLFIGFSFDDSAFGDQLRWLTETFSGAAGPHYVLVREADREKMRAKLTGLPLEVLPYADHGQPLINRLAQLAALVPQAR